MMVLPWSYCIHWISHDTIFHHCCIIWWAYWPCCMLFINWWQRRVMMIIARSAVDSTARFDEGVFIVEALLDEVKGVLVFIIFDANSPVNAFHWIRPRRSIRTGVSTAGNVSARAGLMMAWRRTLMAGVFTDIHGRHYWHLLEAMVMWSWREEKLCQLVFFDCPGCDRSLYRFDDKIVILGR